MYGELLELKDMGFKFELDDFENEDIFVFREIKSTIEEYKKQKRENGSK